MEQNTKKVLEQQKLDWIFNFFDNDDFVNANKAKQFSDTDRVALIIYSRKQTLTEKFTALRKVEETANKTICKDIENWIKYKESIVAYIKNLNREDVVFLVKFNVPNVGNAKLFRTFDTAIKDSSARYFGLSIERIFGDEETIYGKLGNISVDTQTGGITDVNLYMGKLDEHAPSFKSPLYEIKVELACPFKSYDIIQLPIRDKYQIVGDETDNRVIEQWRKEEWSPWKQSWLQMKMSTYDESSYDDGKIEVHTFTQLPFCLDDIKKVPEDEITLSQLKANRIPEREQTILGE